LEVQAVVVLETNATRVQQVTDGSSRARMELGGK
jgi:hypothetical protein